MLKDNSDSKNSAASISSTTATNPSKRIFQRDDVFYVLMGLPIISVLALTLIPLVYTGYFSLLNWNLAMPFERSFEGLANYVEMFQTDLFWTALSNSFYQVFGTVTLQVLIGVPVALLLNRRAPGIHILRTLYLFPMMTTPIVVGLIWRMLFNTEVGFINYVLSLIGLPGLNWLGNVHLAMPAVILTDVWLSTPFVAIIVLAGLQSIPEELYEAARVDGASAWHSFWGITLPLLRPVLVLAVLFRIMDAFKRFDTIFIMTGGGPGTATETLNLHAYFQGFQYLNIGYAAAITLVILAIVLALGVFLIRAVFRD